MTDCIACGHERAHGFEHIGHNCGRLDRLGGGSIEIRARGHTTRDDRCVVCGEDAVSYDGTCIDPACWMRVRDERFPHRRPTLCVHCKEPMYKAHERVCNVRRNPDNRNEHLPCVGPYARAGEKTPIIEDAGLLEYYADVDEMRGGRR